LFELSSARDFCGTGESNWEEFTYGTLVPLHPLGQNPTFPRVSKWNAKPLTVLILSGLLVIIFLILVLPQVDLLDTAFHRNSSPVALKAQFTSAPVFDVIAAVTSRNAGFSFKRHDQSFLPAADSGETVSALLCSFRC
jgi:hypothetical protein